MLSVLVKQKTYLINISCPEFDSSNNTIIMNIVRVPPSPQTHNCKINEFHLNVYEWNFDWTMNVTINHGKRGVGRCLVLGEAKLQLRCPVLG